MEKKNLLREVSNRLHKLRTGNGYSLTQMAEQIGVDRTCYSRYESAKVFPQAAALYALARRFGISLDWLLMERGPMKYTEKQVAIETPKQKTPGLQELVDDEINEMLHHMKENPLLRHEVLMVYHKFKKEQTK